MGVGMAVYIEGESRKGSDEICLSGWREKKLFAGVCRAR